MVAIKAVGHCCQDDFPMLSRIVGKFYLLCSDDLGEVA